MARKLFRGTRPRVFALYPEEPAWRRIFVWAWTQWFERVVGESGDVAFLPVADTEDELRRWLESQVMEHIDLTELDGEPARIVREEFLDQTPLYPEAPELSVEEPFREQKPDNDIEHY